jgi:type IV secretory pathway VirJ component
MTLRPRDRIALAVVVLVALIGGYYLLALKPERQKATALDAAIATQQQTLAQEQQSYTTGREAKASLKTDAAEWAALRLAVPAQSDIPALLRTLQDNAAAAHVTLQAVQLSAATSTATSAAPAAATSSAAPAASTGTASASAPTSVPVSLTFAGGYTALNSLVRRLDSLVVVANGKVHASGPLVSISNVSLTGAPKLTVALTATIYQLAAAPATTGGTP